MKGFVLWVFVLVSFNLRGQFLTDEKSKILVAQALEKMYNHEWAHAEVILKPIYKSYEGHPVTYLLKAMSLQLRYTPLESFPIPYEKHLEYLERCKVSAKYGLEHTDYAEEYTFFMLASSGYIAQAQHYEKNYLKAANEGRKAYEYMKKGFKMASKNPEFYFTNGLYYYYREQYPETHPSIKPLVIVFASGNKSKGISDLKMAMEKAIFTRNEAALFLSGIYLKYENQPQLALPILKNLYRSYPQNDLFLMRYIEASIAKGNSEEVRRLLGEYAKIKNGPLGELSYYLFRGRTASSAKEAKAFLAKCLQVSTKGKFVDDYRAMAFVYLAERFIVEGQNERADQFIKEGQKLAEYTSIKKKIEELKLRIYE